MYLDLTLRNESSLKYLPDVHNRFREFEAIQYTLFALRSDAALYVCAFKLLMYHDMGLLLSFLISLYAYINVLASDSLVIQGHLRLALLPTFFIVSACT